MCLNCHHKWSDHLVRTDINGEVYFYCEYPKGGQFIDCACTWSKLQENAYRKGYKQGVSDARRDLAQ